MIELSMFIVFEGIDGVGKNTQMNLVANWLKNDFFSSSGIAGKKEIFVEVEPTTDSQPGRKLYKLLREIKQDSSFEKASSQQDGIEAQDQKKLLDLYLQDRLQHTKKIRNLLQKGNIVLCSRYDLSSYAYQGLGLLGSETKNHFEKVYQLHQYNYEYGCLIPDLTLFFSLPIEQALERIDDRSNQLGFKQHGFEKKNVLQQVYENYKLSITYLSERDGRRILLLDSSISVTELFDKVKKFLCELIKHHHRNYRKICYESLYKSL